MAAVATHAHAPHLHARESPLSALARQSSYTQARAKGKARATDHDEGLYPAPNTSNGQLAPVSPLLKGAFDEQRASYLTAGSARTDLGIDRTSASYSEYEDEDEETASSRVGGGSRPSDDGRLRESHLSMASARTDDTGPFAYSGYESSDTRPASTSLAAQRPYSDRYSHDQDDRDSFASFMLGQSKEKAPLPLTAPIPEDEPLSVVIPPTPTDFGAPVAVVATSPTAQGRAKSQALTGSRNFSRPLRMSDFSPETSPTTAQPSPSSRLAAPSAHAMLTASTSRSAPSSPNLVAAQLPRPAASAPNSPNMRGGEARQRPAQPEGFTFPPTAPSPSRGAPSLSRGPSSSSSYMPTTPATPHRPPIPYEGDTTASYAARERPTEVLRSPMAMAPSKVSAQPVREARHSTNSSRRSAGGFDDDSSDVDGRSQRSSQRSSRWKFWQRRRTSVGGASDDAGYHSPPSAPQTPAMPPTVAIGGVAHVEDEPLGPPRAIWERAQHSRELSDAERARQQYSPPQMQGQRLQHQQPDSRFLSPSEAQERLAEHPNGVGAASSATRAPSHPRQPSVASYYSVYSLQSDQEVGDATPGDGHYTPPQSSHGHSSEDGSPAQAMPSRQAGATMAKAKQSIDRLRPPPGPSTSHAKLSKHSGGDRVLSPDDPEDCLQLGITCHESGDLERSAFFFERAATLRGGCGSGMLLWGLTLRHGWGCAVDPTRGFAFLQKAAETVVDDLDGVVASGGARGLGDDKEEIAAKAAKAELVLSIYELGMSFRKGWGVKKDKKMALSYFDLASTLGDPDAQQELGFAYLHGKGCKKDKAKAAHYYRLAAAQGIDSFGQQWIWRQKYGGTEP